jgi:hypothetical protein
MVCLRAVHAGDGHHPGVVPLPAGIGVYALFDTIAEDMSEAADAKLPEALGLHESTVRGQHEFKLPGGLASPQAVQATVLRSPAAPLPRKRPSGCCQ